MYFANETASARAILHKLQFLPHRMGYNHLALAVTRYAKGDVPSLTKELYPYVARRFGYSDWHAVERSIRYAVSSTWKNADRQVWDDYFPYCRKAPTNKLVIATLAECLQQNTPPVSGRG